MSGQMDHTAHRIIADLLIELSVGTSVTTGDWAVFYGSMPDSPDSAIAVFSTEGIKDGRVMNDGEVDFHHGINIQIRDAEQEDGYQRANAIAEALDKQVDDYSITVGSSTYTIHAISRKGDVIHVGTEVKDSKRHLFTINATAAITKTA